MCPTCPFHVIFSWLLVIALVWIFGHQNLASAFPQNTSSKAQVMIRAEDQWLVENVNITEGEMKTVTFYVKDFPSEETAEVVFKEDSADGLTHLDFSPSSLPLRYDVGRETSDPLEVNVSGLLVGFSSIKLVLVNERDESPVMEITPEFKVKVFHQDGILDHIFIAVIIILITIAFINMGCAINLNVIRTTIKKPVSPAIGLASQYFFMPLVSYGLGYALFYSRPELWLGLFITGCCPGGGGSNLWTYILDGSLDLSITMTLLSTIVAFAMLPLWTMALAPSIFPDGFYSNFPYARIFYLVLGLVIPCSIGVGIRRCSPKAADCLKKMLKPLSLIFILFILTFGVYAKLYLFQFFTWQVILAGFCLPFLGYAFGATLAVLFKRNFQDLIAISIETGIQNTGLAFGVINIALSSFSPLEDIAIVLPVAVSTMTPIPPLIYFIVNYFKRKMSKNIDKDPNFKNIPSPSSSLMPSSTH